MERGPAPRPHSHPISLSLSPPSLHLSRTTTTFLARQRATLGWRVRDALGLNPVTQRYFPQCQPCSLRQSAAVRSGARTLQLHAGGTRPWYGAGTLVGLRHYADPARAAPPGRGGLFGGGHGGGVGTAGRGGGLDLDGSALDDLAAAIGRMQQAAASAWSGGRGEGGWRERGKRKRSPGTPHSQNHSRALPPPPRALAPLSLSHHHTHAPPGAASAATRR